jgi:hypothetical protein
MSYSRETRWTLVLNSQPLFDSISSQPSHALKIEACKIKFRHVTSKPRSFVEHTCFNLETTTKSSRHQLCVDETITEQAV